MAKVDTLRRPTQGPDFRATRPFLTQDAIASSQIASSVINRLAQERANGVIYAPSIQGRTESHHTNARSVGPVPIYEQSREQLYKNAKERLSPTSSTREYIDFFKRFHREEGLPKDWQKLQYGDTQVGFSIKKQMELLKDDTPVSRSTHARQTYLDLQGYLIEYISPYNVFPWQHEVRVTSDGTAHLVDAKYGGRRMVDTVTDEERGGTVKSVLEVIDQAVVSGKVPDGSMFLQISPQDDSPTGLFQDNGSDIRYKDTHLMFSQVRGNRLEGFTVKTDFTKAECRELIKRMTRKILPVDAPVEDYIRSFAFIDPTKSKLKTIDDLVGVAADVRSDISFGSKNAYKDKSWKYVQEQIGQGENLYDWTETSQAILKQYVQDVIHDNPERKELPYYIAATILRAVQAAQIDQLAKIATKKATQELHTLKLPAANFGELLKATAAITGCAGGGPAASADGRLGTNTGQVGRTTAETCPKISCPCGWEATDAQAAAVQAGSITRCPECKAPPGEGVAGKKKQEEIPAPANRKEVALAA